MAVRKITVVGGGVAGLSAAHELAERSGAGVDFEIHVYDKRHTVVGGKARSIPVPNSGKDGRLPLPGEHGFRFFPGFYKHLPDTMSRIPYADTGSDRPMETTVFDNLEVASRLELARFDEAPIVIATRFPKTLRDLEVDLKAIFDSHTGLLPGEIEHFAGCIWQVLTSCQERRLAQYEAITWWDFIGAAQRSEAYQKLLGEGLSRSLLANDPLRASARTVGDTNVQLMLGMVEPAHPTDRLLNGPTSQVWLEPWREHLQALGVQIHLGEMCESFGIEDGRVTNVKIAGAGPPQTVTGDAYIFALPAERMAALLQNSAGRPDNPLAAYPDLNNIVTVSQDVRWMNGVQFFLFEDVPITKGHVLYVDSPWGVTSISESQFWPDEHLANRGDGTVHGILSACISCWDAVGIKIKKKAVDCTRQEIAQEVWAQIQRSVNVEGKVILDDANLHSVFVDPDLKDHRASMAELTDAEPLFVNFINSWALRPTPSNTIVPNLLLASDYVQTYTDVACMEAANEAARHAVNAVLTMTGSSAEPCELWKLHEPDWLWFWREEDKRRFDQGLPWDGKLWGRS